MHWQLPYSGAGTGILRAIDEGVKMYFNNDEQTHEFVVTIPRKATDEPVSSEGTVKSNQVEEQSNSKSNQVIQRTKVTKKQKDILNFCSVPRSSQEIMDRIGIDNQSKNRKRYIEALIDMGSLKTLYPESRTASNQRYVKVKKPQTDIPCKP